MHQRSCCSLFHFSTYSPVVSLLVMKNKRLDTWNCKATQGKLVNKSTLQRPLWRHQKLLSLLEEQIEMATKQNFEGNTETLKRGRDKCFQTCGMIGILPDQRSLLLWFAESHSHHTGIFCLVIQQSLFYFVSPHCQIRLQSSPSSGRLNSLWEHREPPFKS